MVFSLLFLSLLHCRSREERGFEPRQPFLASEEEAPVKSWVAADPKSWQAVPLAGRLIGLVPRDFDRWQWAAVDSLTLIIHSTGGRVDGVIYVEALVASPWASLELDGFHRTVAPQLASEVFPWGTSRSGLADGLSEEYRVPKSAVIETLVRLRSRTLGRGLGFQSRRTAFTGWRWVGKNPQGIRLRLGRLEGTWGPQPPLSEEMRRCLETLAEASPKLAVLNTAESPSRRESTLARNASLVLGSALLRRDLGIHLAVLFEQETSRAVVDELAAFTESLRRPGRGEIEGLLEAEGRNDLERFVRRLGWQLQLGEQRVTEEDLEFLRERVGGSQVEEQGGGM